MNTNTEKTASEKFCEIAAWLKRQDTEFTKNFKSMKSIIRTWKHIPEGSRRFKVKNWLAKNAKTYAASKLMLAVNSEFGFRYFDKAPYRYKVRLVYSSWRWRWNDTVNHEVKMLVYDNYEGVQHGAVGINLKDLGDVKRAAERLLKEDTKHLAHDMEVSYGDNLKELMKNDRPTDDELQEHCEIPGL